MVALLLPKRRTTQPQTPVGIDWSNPMTRGLIGAYLPCGSYANLVGIGGTLTPLTTPPATIISPIGSAFAHLSGSSALYAPVYGTPFTTSTNGYSIFWAGQVISASVVGPYNSLILGICYGNADTPPYISYGLESNNTGIYAGAGSNGGITSPISRVQGATYTIGASFDTAGNVMTYNKGILVESINYGAIPFSTSATLAFGGYIGDSSRSPNVNSALGLVFNRVLTAVEHTMIAANPWQLFSPGVS